MAIAAVVRERRSASKMGLAWDCIMDGFRLHNSMRHKNGDSKYS